MPTNDEINTRVRHVIEGGFQHFTNEVNAFHAHPAIDTNVISIFLNRAHQYAMLYWGYEYMAQSLGTADEALLNRIAQLRHIVDGQVQQVQNLLNQYRAAQGQHTYRPPQTGQTAIQDAQRYEQQVQAEVLLKRQQMFAYTNRLRELTQGGLPFVQAEIIAKQETGYRG